MCARGAAMRRALCWIVLIACDRPLTRLLALSDATPALSGNVAIRGKTALTVTGARAGLNLTVSLDEQSLAHHGRCLGSCLQRRHEDVALRHDASREPARHWRSRACRADQQRNRR